MKKKKKKKKKSMMLEEYGLVEKQLPLSLFFDENQNLWDIK